MSCERTRNASSSSRKFDPSRQRALLEARVAWLNGSGLVEPANRRLRQDLSFELEQFDREQKGSIDESELSKSVDDWLETAGLIGGPEREQDPMLRHPVRWHSNPERTVEEAVTDVRVGPVDSRTER